MLFALGSPLATSTNEPSARWTPTSHRIPAFAAAPSPAAASACTATAVVSAADVHDASPNVCGNPPSGQADPARNDTAAGGTEPARASVSTAYDWEKPLLKSPNDDLSENRPDGVIRARNRASTSTRADPNAVGSKPCTCALSESFASDPAYDSVLPLPT